MAALISVNRYECYTLYRTELCTNFVNYLSDAFNDKICTNRDDSQDIQTLQTLIKHVINEFDNIFCKQDIVLYLFCHLRIYQLTLSSLELLQLLIKI